MSSGRRTPQKHDSDVHGIYDEIRKSTEIDSVDWGVGKGLDREGGVLLCLTTSQFLVEWLGVIKKFGLMEVMTNRYDFEGILIMETSE